MSGQVERIDTLHDWGKADLITHVILLETALGEAEKIMTALALSECRKDVCADKRLSAALGAARLCLESQ